MPWPNRGSTNASTIPSAMIPKTTVNPAMKLIATSSSIDWSRRRSPSSIARSKISTGSGATVTWFL
jgi:hypothetical protein